MVCGASSLVGVFAHESALRCLWGRLQHDFMTCSMPRSCVKGGCVPGVREGNSEALPFETSHEYKGAAPLGHGNFKVSIKSW